MLRHFVLPTVTVLQPHGPQLQVQAYTRPQVELCGGQELGPRFTMKLLSLQRGTFDSKTGEYEWVFSTKQAKNRLKFSL